MNSWANPMDKYFYVVSQLPMLFWDREPSTSSEAFLAEAEKWLSPSDFAILRDAGIKETRAAQNLPPLLGEYRNFERTFRTELAQWRKAHYEGQDYKPQTFPVAMIKDVNPLEAERAILKRRWDLVDDLELGHHFDLEFLIAFYLKLQILEKLSAFDKDK